MRATDMHQFGPAECRRRSSVALLLGSAVLVLAGCSTAPPPQTTLIASGGDIDMSTVELRLRVYGFAEESLNDIVRAADQILESTEDVAISRNALRWKINSVVGGQLTAFSLDPLIALRDMWVLTVQMRELFETGAGKDAFGPHQSIAIETVRRNERRAEAFAASIYSSGDVTQLRRDVQAYAAAHPFADLNLLRETATAEFAGALAADRVSGLAAVGDLSLQVGDLTERLKYYAASLPEQFRWQSELLFLDIMSDYQIAQFLDDIGAVSEAAERLSALADSVPAIVDAQARAVVQALTLELAATLREVDRQRLETLDALTAERVAVLEGIAAERAAALEGIGAVTAGTLGEEPMPAALEGVVDYAFGRALLLLGLLFVGGLVFAILLRILPKRSTGA